MTSCWKNIQLWLRVDVVCCYSSGICSTMPLFFFKYIIITHSSWSYVFRKRFIIIIYNHLLVNQLHIFGINILLDSCWCCHELCIDIRELSPFRLVIGIGLINLALRLVIIYKLIKCRTLFHYSTESLGDIELDISEVVKSKDNGFLLSTVDRLGFFIGYNGDFKFLFIR